MGESLAGRAANLSLLALAISDARRLHRVAAELPDGRVEAKALSCRAPNPYPLGDGAKAMHLQDLEWDWGLPS